MEEERPSDQAAGEDSSMRVIVSNQVLASVHSLSVAASKEDIAPIITQLAITREGDALRAMATDRFMILAGRYDDAQFQDWEEGDTLLVDPKALKSVVDLKRANRFDISPVEIIKDENSGMALATISDTTTLPLGTVQGVYPPIMRLIERGTEPNGAASLNLRPDFLARLSKVLPPVIKPERYRTWRFEFRTAPDSSKPQPVYAHYSDGLSYRLEALIQPQLDKR